MSLSTTLLVLSNCLSKFIYYVGYYPSLYCPLKDYMNAHNNVLFLCRRTEQSYNSRNCMTAFLEIVPWGYFLIGCCFYFFVFCHKTMSRREKGSAVYLIFVANKVWAKLTYNSFTIANFCCLWQTLCELLLNVPTTGHKWLVG